MVIIGVVQVFFVFHGIVFDVESMRSSLTHNMLVRFLEKRKRAERKIKKEEREREREREREK